MSRIMEGAKEAAAVAKGEIPAARLHHQGHTYVPLAEYEALRLNGLECVTIANRHMNEKHDAWLENRDLLGALTEQRVLTARAKYRGWLISLVFYGIGIALGFAAGALWWQP